MTAAVARQGTARAVKYTVVTNTSTTLTLNLLESLVWGLCFEHQVVFHPTSLPAPLTIASGFSKRGTMMLKEVGPVYVNGAIEYQATNQQLGYWIKELFGTRFNA
ncbi:hypothetical protein CAEBREN_08251 [Caenorhabditis brenneri]|uniref:Piwi domain-containing protein n=1 Tax=Caenorhabditis brenneri TaxID=135651 RepID=G0NQB0_CAEBE|nr:hypothetical protein CAEBREN_08251 [Caenorhabditis brenneri]